MAPPFLGGWQPRLNRVLLRLDRNSGGGQEVIDVVTPDLYSAYADELKLMFQQRFRVFKRRLGWNVPSENDEERDSFDQLYPIYLLAKD